MVSKCIAPEIVVGGLSPIHGRKTQMLKSSLNLIYWHFMTLPPKREMWLLFTLAGIQFTNILDFMIMMPLGPQFIEIFNITDTQFSFLVSSYTFAAGASGLLASLYIDRFDRKKLLLALYILFGLATLACGLAPHYWAFLAARVAAGIFGGVLSALITTIVADVVPFERRGRAMGIVMTAFSASTVAGVPLGLYLAAKFSWHMPFFLIAAFVPVLAAGVVVTLPSLTAHLAGNAKKSAFSDVGAVLSDANHWRAFLFTSLIMMGGFVVIPFITIYLRANHGWQPEQITYNYLFGGLATLVSARFVGKWTDSKGKVPVFTLMALLVPVPILAMTLSDGLPNWSVYMIGALFFGLMSARMIPGMAIVSSAAPPHVRGTFMTLNSAVQSGAMGVAALIGGALISRDANNHVQNYWVAGVVAALASVMAILVARTIKVHGARAIIPRGDLS
jgi:predicted MFS family arabinose efflux permease